jgi:predicted DNA-binding transcriptional regulator YafY
MSDEAFGYPITVPLQRLNSDVSLLKDYDPVLRKKWHASEQREILPNGDVEMSYAVAGADEIKRWIYSWLPNVEVLEPAWLREQVQTELAQAAQKHGNHDKMVEPPITPRGEA